MSIEEGQIAYYRARASEYDEWFLRQGRYDRGPEFRERWFREIEQVATALWPVSQGAEVLELACGTGLWTQRLAANSRRIVAVDASPEVIELNRQRVNSAKVEYHVADIFAWEAREAFDLIFFSFWLSHVPRERFTSFWDSVRGALRPGGQAFFLDSLLEQSSSALDHAAPDKSGVVRRKLNDGREFDIVKIFYEPGELEQMLVQQGWRGRVRTTETFFLYGAMMTGCATT